MTKGTGETIDNLKQLCVINENNERKYRTE